MDCNLYQSRGQVSSDQAGVIFRDFLRGSVREMICEVIAAEVEDLCGPKHSPTGGDTFRSGSSSGRVLLDGQRVHRALANLTFRGSGNRSDTSLSINYEVPI